MEEATDHESVAQFVEEVLAESGWQIDRIRRGATRLEPPDWFWKTFVVDIRRDDAERSLRLVAKGALNSSAWERLARRVPVEHVERPCDPANAVGYPRVFPETQHVYWFYPYDLRMSNLPAAADPLRIAPVLLGLEGDLVSAESLARTIQVERVRYVPEVGAILCYTIDVAGTPTRIYGKVQPGHRGLRTFQIVEGLWKAAARFPGYLNLPRPLGYIAEMGLLIEEAIRGRPVSNKRTSMEFMLMPEPAAEALAVIQESGVDGGERIQIEAELTRLDQVVEQFAYVLPDGHFLLRDLVAHMREHLRKIPEEDWLPTHGDLKYDQFMFHNGEFTLLDFDYFANAETSYDLGKFCAYLVPSRPRDWRDSVAVEAARVRFIRRYRELRPHATLQRFAIYESLQFALRAMSFMWAQAPGWQRMAETFLVLGFERLNSRLPE